MSAKGLPYRLRSNKYVDRELFSELVSVVTSRAPDNYVYISMGGMHLVDHFSVYRRAGLQKLLAFDFDPEIVERQKFNVPCRTAVCDEFHSSQLPDKLEEILRDYRADQAIIWLDFTEKKYYGQLKEICATVAKLQPGDVLRVTLNADSTSLRKKFAELNKADKEKTEAEKLALVFQSEVVEFSRAG